MPAEDGQGISGELGGVEEWFARRPTLTLTQGEPAAGIILFAWGHFPLREGLPASSADGPVMALMKISVKEPANEAITWRSSAKTVARYDVVQHKPATSL